MALAAEIITVNFDDASTSGIEFTLKDTDGVVVADVAVTGLTYTLTDTSGNVVNGRENVVVSDPGGVETIILTDDDMLVSGSNAVEIRKRLLTMKWTYNDTVLGNGSKKNKEYLLVIKNYINV